LASNCHPCLRCCPARFTAPCAATPCPPSQPLKAYLAKFREAEKKALAATNKAKQQDNDA